MPGGLVVKEASISVFTNLGHRGQGGDKGGGGARWEGGGTVEWRGHKEDASATLSSLHPHCRPFPNPLVPQASEALFP